MQGISHKSRQNAASEACRAYETPSTYPDEISRGYRANSVNAAAHHGYHPKGTGIHLAPPLPDVRYTPPHAYGYAYGYEGARQRRRLGADRRPQV